MKTNLEQKHAPALFRPFAWAYQLYLYAGQVLAGRMSRKTVRDNRQQAILLDMLGVHQDDVGNAAFRDGHFVEGKAPAYKKRE